MKNNNFYLRRCKRCNDFFKARGKHFTICPECVKVKGWIVSEVNK